MLKNHTITQTATSLILNPNGKVKALLLWMHGLGDTYHGFK